MPLRWGDLPKFHKDWFSHSIVHRGDTLTDTHRQQRDLISLLLFFLNNGSGEKGVGGNGCNFLVLYKLGQDGGQRMWQ
jgi:hypothetical protein